MDQGWKAIEKIDLLGFGLVSSPSTGNEEALQAARVAAKDLGDAQEVEELLQAGAGWGAATHSETVCKTQGWIIRSIHKFIIHWCPFIWETITFWHQRIVAEAWCWSWTFQRPWDVARSWIAVHRCLCGRCRGDCQLMPLMLGDVSEGTLKYVRVFWERSEVFRGFEWGHGRVCQLGAHLF